MTILHNKNKYTVYFNLLGVNPKNVFVDIDLIKHEFAVYVGKKTAQKKSASFWIFTVPYDGCLLDINAKFKGGALEVSVPRIQARPLLMDVSTAA